VNIFKLVASIGSCFLVAFLGGIATSSSVSVWYLELNKPFFNPPNWIFGPVWTVLYFLMGVSLYIIWNNSQGTKNKSFALKMFAAQLALNLLWSIVFFGMQEPLLAFVVIVLLWFAITMTIKYFYRISRVAGNLLIPYILWVSFALILNLGIVIFNI
jgi:translocator protein